METKLLDGKASAQTVRQRVKQELSDFLAQHTNAKAPKLVVIVVGDDPASAVYVRNKEKACEEVGIVSEAKHFNSSVTNEELLTEIARLNTDDSVTGILVQLPLPEGLDEKRITDFIDPDKDVDGFHPVNVGKLSLGTGDGLVSCTPAGIVELLKQNHIEIDGKHVVVAGRSNIVGKPLSLLMLQENATVTICHSHTQNLKELAQQADIFVSAIGKPHFFDATYIKRGAVVVDVGIHRTKAGLIGDVDTESVMGIASAVTPVPGGVGPMTVAMLLQNCLHAMKKRFFMQ